MGVRSALGSALASVFLTSPTTLQAGPPRICILLPGQTFVPGVGVTGTPAAVSHRTEFTVRLLAVDDFFNVDPSYEGPLHDVRVASDTPPLGEPAPPPARRFGTSISGENAATSLTNGSLRVSLGGARFRRYSSAAPRLRSRSAMPGAGGGLSLRLTWDPDPRALNWAIYRSTITATALADLDRDGLPDAGYGTCVIQIDPDPADTVFDDAQDPAFMYAGTMRMSAFGAVQETSLGLTAGGIEGANAAPCT